MGDETAQPQPAVELPHGPMVVKAWAPWCSNCRMLAPIIDEIAESTGVAVLDLQVDDHPDLVERLGVRSVPTLIALDDATELGRLQGIQPRDAVLSLFDLAAGTGTAIRRQTPTALVAARGASAAALALAGVVTGSVVLGVVGAGLAVWAVAGLIRR